MYSVKASYDHRDQKGKVNRVGYDPSEAGQVFHIDRDFHRVGDVGIIESIEVPDLRIKPVFFDGRIACRTESETTPPRTAPVRDLPDKQHRQYS